MSLSFYLQGVIASALVIGLWAWAGRASMRALVPDWPVTLRTLGGVTVATTGVIVTAEVVGSVGQFRRVALVVASAIAVVVTLALLRRFAPQSPEGTTPIPAKRVTWQSLGVAGLVALAAGCLVFAQWSMTAKKGFEHGIGDVDSQSYHLSHAARFVQDHDVIPIHYSSADATVPYHPHNSELLDAVGMLTMGNDILVLGLNLALLPVGLLAAFAVGRRFRSGAASVVAYTVLAAAPLISAIYAASAGNDFMAIAFFLAAVAFVLTADDGSHPRVAFALAGLGAGLALGTKLTMAAPIAGLTLTVVWLMRKQLANVAVYVGAAVLAGGYWYVKNFIQVGSPVPTLKLGILPAPPIKLVELQGKPIANYLGDKDFWLHTGPSGLTRFLGEGWPLVLVAIAATAVLLLLSARKRDAPARAVVIGLTLTAVGTLAAYLVTPGTGGDANGHPVLFVFNIRYGLPGLVLALVLAPSIPWLRNRQAWVAVGGLGMLLIALVSKPHIQKQGLALALLLIVVVYLVTQIPPTLSRWGLVAVVVAGVLAGFPLTRRYERTRYAHPTSPRTELYAFGRVVPPHARVALVGVPLQYALYGPRLLTHVDYLGDLRPNNEFTNYPTCDTWRAALRAGKYDFVVSQPIPIGTTNFPAATGWTASLPGSKKLAENAAAQIFDVRNVTSWPSC